MTVTSLLELTIKPERLNDAERIIDETLVATRGFAGNLGCTVAVDTENPTHYVIVERWESLAADDAYRAFRSTPEGANELGDITSARVLVRYTDVSA
ncbi:putative quinol monooxygenase [Gryllotalpicola reticulitermitis]|uniref:Quinol monooxygenase n=1 Tax=Gryllotalpicola reticulitermitis TaxID=1184153 RepID=A0ABV8Q2E2_9MICO